MAALTKADLTLYLIEQLDLNHREARVMVEAFFAHIGYSLSEGNEVKLSGFGNFLLRRKNARPGRNPKTGEEKIISARTVVTIRPGQKLRARINQVQIPSISADDTITNVK